MPTRMTHDPACAFDRGPLFSTNDDVVDVVGWGCRTGDRGRNDPSTSTVIRGIQSEISHSLSAIFLPPARRP